MPEMATGGLVILPAGADAVAARDGLERHRPEALHDHPAVREHRALIGAPQHARDEPARQMVQARAVAVLSNQKFEMELSISALLGNRIGQHHVERRQAIGGHDEHGARVELVDVANFSGVDFSQAAQRGRMNGLAGAVG